MEARELLLEAVSVDCRQRAEDWFYRSMGGAWKTVRSRNVRWCGLDEAASWYFI